MITSAVIYKSLGTTGLGVLGLIEAHVRRGRLSPWLITLRTSLSLFAITVSLGTAAWTYWDLPEPAAGAEAYLPLALQAEDLEPANLPQGAAPIKTVDYRESVGGTLYLKSKLHWAGDGQRPEKFAELILEPFLTEGGCTKAYEHFRDHFLPEAPAGQKVDLSGLVSVGDASFFRALKGAQGFHYYLLAVRHGRYLATWKETGAVDQDPAAWLERVKRKADAFAKMD